jgi:pyruvate kinase
MLSGETAIGKYPVATVAMMDRIIRRAEEASLPTPDVYYRPAADNHSYTVALAARRVVESDDNMRGVACFTRSGYTALLMSKVHPNAPIFAFSPDEAICRRLALARGVVPVHAPLVQTSEEMLRMVDQLLVDGRHVALGEEVVVVASMPVKAAGTTNFLKLHSVGESRHY